MNGRPLAALYLAAGLLFSALGSVTTLGVMRLIDKDVLVPLIGAIITAAAGLAGTAVHVRNGQRSKDAPGSE